MQELERTINIYHTAFIVFLILTIVFLAASVLFFFWFNIRGIYDLRTGRGARKTIQKMQELNDQTGRLREDIVTNTPVSLSPENRIVAPPTEKRRENRSEQGYQAGGDNQNSYAEGSQETTLLAGEGSQETVLLQPYGETTVLSANQITDDPQLEKKSDLPGAFKIEKEIMWVHTEEKL